MSEVLRRRRILANQPSAESPSSNSESTPQSPPPTASASPPKSSSTSSPPPPPEESSPPPPSPPPPPPPSKSKSTPSPPQHDESQQSSPSPSSTTSPPSTTSAPPPSTTSPSPPSTTTPSSSTTPPSPSSSSSNQSPSPPTPTSSSSKESPTTNTGNSSQQSSPVPPNPAAEQQIPQIPAAVTGSPPLITALPISSSSTNQGTTTPVLSPPSTGSKAPPPPPTTQASDSSSQHGIPLGAAVGATIGFVCVVAFFLIICSARRRKKRRDQFLIPQQNPKFHSGGYQIATQQGPVVHSGSSESGYIYNSQIYSSGGSESGVNNHPPEMFGGSKSYFSYEEMMEMTRGFSQQNILGEGGFGCVYKGWLPDGKPVAVKQLKAGSGQGEREFKAEVEIISRVHHRHLVSLVGYCIADQHRLLIYEFVPNKTLEHHLHSTRGKVLEWTKRVKIALGSAKGLAYLHEDCHPKIIHRDIKSANILIDDAFEAQVADFGLARLSDATQTHVSTRVMGTFGYLAPEYAASGKLTDRSDVYSFGVVILELITGKKPVDPNRPLGDESLVEWARPLLIQAIESGDLSEIVDPRLEKQYVEREMFRMIEVAAACVRHSSSKRPRMAQVVRALDMDGELTDLSNGVKFGQSTAYDSRQYSQDISRFRQLALGSDTSSEYNLQSGDYSTRGFTSSDSETHAINRTNRECS